MGVRGRSHGPATVGTAGLNLAATFGNFVLVLALARILGKTQYGAYAFAFAWAGVFTIVAVFGLHTLVVRDLAAYRAREQWSLARGLLRWTNRTVLATSGRSRPLAGASASATHSSTRIRRSCIRT